MAKGSQKTIISRIDKRLKALAPKGKKQLSDRAGALRSGLSPDGIRTLRRQLESGRQSGVRSDTLEKLAKGLETTTQWLLREEGPENVAEPVHLDSEQVLADSDPTMTVPVAGFVSAGAQVVLLPLAAGELDRVPAPAGSTDSTQCLEIRGDSLGELFDRWLVFYNDVRSPVTPDLIGKLCVAGLADDRVVVKKIKRVDGHYALFSNTEPPILGVTIMWAAKVIDMRPR